MTHRVLYVALLNPFVSGGGSQATRAYMDATLEIFGRNKVDVMVNKGVLVPDKYKGINFIFVPQRPKLLSYVLFSFGVLGRFAVYVARYLNSHREQYQCCIINGSLESGWCFKHVEDSGVEKVTTTYFGVCNEKLADWCSNIRQGNVVGSLKRCSISRNRILSTKKSNQE